MLEIKNVRQLFENYEKIMFPFYKDDCFCDAKQCEQLFKDILNPKKDNYFLGQMIFEKRNKKLYTIDGQQRLSIIFLLISSIVKTDTIKKPNRINETYIEKGMVGFHSKEVIIKKIFNKKFENPETVVKNAKLLGQILRYFIAELKKLSANEICKVLQTAENSMINAFCVPNRTIAMQIYNCISKRGSKIISKQ